MFIETPRFPDSIARNMVRRRRAGVTTVTFDSGAEQHTVRWAQRRREYDVGFAIKTEADYAIVSAWWDALDGPADGFRVRDHADFTCDAANGLLRPLHGTVQVGTAGSGFGVPSYQLQKRYAVGAKSHDRDIRKPVSGQVAVRRGGVAVTVGVSAGNIAIDTTTGVITFVADQSRTISSITVGATTVLTLASALSPNVSIGQRLFVTGVSGTAAAVLNNLSHAVTAVSGAQVTLGTATTGLTATGGTAALYPQAAESLDWAGQFDVPVRFAQDELGDVIVQRGSGGQYLLEAPQVSLIEIRV